MGQKLILWHASASLFGSGRKGINALEALGNASHYRIQPRCNVVPGAKAL